MTPVVENVSIDRGATAHLWFRPKANVNAPTGIDMTGSMFELVIIDVLGAVLLTRTVSPTLDTIKFDLTPDDTAALPAGAASSYSITRVVDDVREVWVRGSIDAKGIVNG